jgi:peptidoglycan/xylan/chitin deacetylase (PgdA/CDA1 family)
MIETLPLLAFPSSGTLTIMIFHRVLSAPDPLRPGEPDTARFDRLMRFVAGSFTVLPLPDAVAALADDRLPRRTCCITFDDGYADNLTNALPILERYRLPATVFVATGYLDGGRMFNDAIIDAIGKTPKAVLDLSEIELGIYPVGDTAERQAAVAAILRQIKFRAPELRDAQVRRFLEIAECGPLPDDIMLSSGQLREMSRRGIEIGGHTVAHTILTTLEDDRALREMIEGRERIEAVTGRTVSSFAYPNGLPGRDFADRHVAMARAAGFARAVTTAPGVGRPGCDVFRLPRFTPWARSLVKASAQLVRNARQDAVMA